MKKIQQGEVVVFDKSIADQETLREMRGRIAYMPQGLGRNLYPTLSVFENIDFFGRLFGLSATERRSKIDELLTATSLEKFEARPAGKLSGGMKQKLSLCCALINDPDLLILDEPTTGVDPLSRGQFWDLINTIRARRPQMSVIVATAYMDEAERFDWLMAMDDGKIIATGTLKELLAKTGEPNLDEAFIAMMPEAKRALHKKVVVRPRVASPDETPAIEAEGLTRRFGDFVAVDHVSFRIPRGEIFGFLGSNGCGKSTTMKMLVGFLPASSGTCKLFGEPMGSNDMQARRNVGYMTQAFSLYGELTVAQNLELHAQLYHLPPEKVAGRDRGAARSLRPEVRRRRAAGQPAARHEATPPARGRRAARTLHSHSRRADVWRRPDRARRLLAHADRPLARRRRDDFRHHPFHERGGPLRPHLAHARRQGARRRRAAGACQGARQRFARGLLRRLSRGGGGHRHVAKRPRRRRRPPPKSRRGERPKRFKIGRLWAYARRETVELLRDPIRLAFALVGPIILMFAFGFGISFDIENLATATFDQDETPQSRDLLQGFDGSRYFSVQPPITSAGEAERRLRSGNTQIVVEVPPGFGRDLLNDRTPEVDATVDGAMTFRGETSKNYVTGVIRKQGEELQRSLRRAGSANAWTDDDIQTRFRYNQAFLSVNAMVPSIFMLLLCLIPAIMSAIAVVREKETGSIANFRSTPITRFEYLIGKQLPYIAVAMIAFFVLLLIAIFIFRVPPKGPFLVLLVGTIVYVVATVGFGVLISSFTRTQVAAVFATAILSIVPAVNFSGMLAPVSSLSGGARVIGLSFPSSWYQQVSVGVFAKALGIVDLWRDIAAIALIALVFLAISLALLRKQEA